ncbi:MAG: OFA family oxalate/formate antiporter-like MFS transporter [Gammaproteobacteria bacterium]|jgi:OFA family oxalate/formate antiporter-like MFS transporter
MKTFFYGWVVTASAFMVLFLTYGVQYSFGIFVPAMMDDLGWQHASLGGAFSLYTVVYTGFSLITGRLTDSFGPRRIVGIGAILLGMGIMVTSQVSSQWQLFFWYGIVAALGMSTAYIPCNMTVVRWFQRRRGLALGLASSGASCGILVVPLFASLMIDKYDWRIGLLVLGAILFVITSIAAHFMVRDPEQMGLLPDGEGRLSLARERSPDAIGLIEPAVQASGWTLREASTTASFWTFLVAFLVTMLTVTVPFVHIASFARDIGLSNMSGAMTISVIGLFAFAGSMFLGALSDRIGRKVTIVISFVSQVIAFTLFLNADNATTLYLGAAAFGFFYGSFATLFPALVGDLFGPAHAGAIGGLIFAAGGLLGGWGPALAGYLRDVQGDYRLVFLSCLVTALCGLLLFALLPRPQRS